MQLRVTGKNIDVGDALRAQIGARLEVALGKYFDRGWSAQVTIEKVRSSFRTDCRVHLDSGMDLQSGGQAGDAYQSFDQAAERLEKRLRRYKRRLKDHHANNSAARAVPATDYVIAAPEEKEDETDTADDNPVIIAETSMSIRQLTVGMAVMAMDLAEAPLMVFRNAGNDRLNVVYRRADGNIGWIDPPDSGE